MRSGLKKLVVKTLLACTIEAFGAQRTKISAKSIHDAVPRPLHGAAASRARMMQNRSLDRVLSRVVKGLRRDGRGGF